MTFQTSTCFLWRNKDGVSQDANVPKSNKYEKTHLGFFLLAPLIARFVRIIKTKGFDDSVWSRRPKTERQKKNQREPPRLRRTGFIITLLFVSVSANQLIKPRRLFFCFYQPPRIHEKVESARLKKKQGNKWHFYLRKVPLLIARALSARRPSPASRLPGNFSSSGGKSQLD